MFDVVQIRFDLVAVSFFEALFNRGGAANVPNLLPHQRRAGQMRKHELQTSPIVRARLTIDRHVFNIAPSDPTLAQAEVDRHGRQAGPMFDSSEPLLFRSRDQLAVNEQAGGRVSVERVKAKNDHFAK